MRTARPIYLDYNATTPVHPAVVDAMLPFFAESFGNPSSVHRLGQDARRAVDLSRGQVGRLIGAKPGEVFFVASGTEADNLAIRGVIGRARGGGAPPHIVTSAVEHAAVLETCRQLEAQGVALTVVGVDEDGCVDPDAVAAAIEERTVLVSLMLANNDVGTLQPVREVARLAHERGVLVHTDAVQALGKIPVDVDDLGVDLLSLSAHKLFGPKGVGALYARQGTALAAQITGGEQELRRRSGTENVPGIVGLGQACELAATRLAAQQTVVKSLRDRLQQAITDRISGATVNGHPEQRLGNTLNVAFAGVEGSAVLINLDLAGIAASVGSACASGTVTPPHVLLAMGQTESQALAAVRFSLGPDTTAAEVDATVTALEPIVPRLREV